MSKAEQLVTENLALWSSAVKAKSSAGRGSSKKLELYGVRKLRELALELAVRGMLSAQDSEDEPTRNLLKRIAAERTHLIKEKVVKKQKALPEFSAEETPFRVPQGWEWARLDDTSPMPLTDGDWIEKRDQDENGKIRLIQLADLGVNEFKDVSRKYVNNKTFERLKCTELHPEDVLIARLPSPIGRACVFPGLAEQAITAVDVAIHRPLGFISNRYLVHALNSLTLRKQVESYGKGATRFRIATGNLKSLFIPIPPLAEQHRIVAKVDELMSLCDQLEEEQENNLETHKTLVSTLLNALTSAAADASRFADAWQRIKENFDILFTTESSVDQLKQTILQLAVMGKLVKQNPEDEPAIEILKKIILEREQESEKSKINIQKYLTKPNQDEHSLTVPEGWEITRVGALFSAVYGKGLPTSRLTEDGYKVFGANGIIGNYSHYTYEDQQLLISCRGAYSGKPNISPPQCFVTSNSIVLESSWNNLCLKFFFYALTSAKKDKIVTGSAQPQVTSSNLNPFPLPLPPLAEQHRIVAKVDELMMVCDQLKANLSQAQDTQLKMADSIVEQAIHSPA